MPRNRTKPRDVNSIRSLAQLFGEWDHGLPAAVRKSFLVSAAGNINQAGELGGTYADIFTPQEAQFAAALEPGVRPLVEALTRAGFVTYTSCEGHRYEGASSECHVGIVPRRVCELRYLLRALRTCVARFNRRLLVCQVAVYPWYLYDKASARHVPVIDLYLHRRPRKDLYDYFEHRSEDALSVAAFLHDTLSGAAAAPCDHVAPHD